MNSKDVKGTDHKGCEWYDKGVCQSEDCVTPGHERCIGTRMCDNFWAWFLRENKLAKL